MTCRFITGDDGMIDELCPFVNQICRHVSRTVNIKTVCIISTRKPGRITKMGDPWCNDQNAPISEISFCLHHQDSRGGSNINGGSNITSGNISEVITGKTKQLQLEVGL